METRPIYAGIFVNETGQQLLSHSMAQLQATLGTAWTACEPKENRLEVFGKCLDIVDTWNEKTFAEECEISFCKQSRAAECWRNAFVTYVRQVYNGGKTQVRVTMPSETAYVQALLTASAKHPFIRSGRYFTCELSLERKDAVMDVIRQAMAQLCDEFVLEQDPEPVSEPTPEPDLCPDDSASQVGSRRRVEASESGSSTTQHAKSDASETTTSRSSHPRLNDVKKTAKSVTILTQ